MAPPPTPSRSAAACEDRQVTFADGGLALSRSYFADLVEPTIRQHLPELRYAAARLGFGSEVLGLDDEMCRAHDWGLRLKVFVRLVDVPWMPANELKASLKFQVADLCLLYTSRCV